MRKDHHNSNSGQPAAGAKSRAFLRLAPEGAPQGVPALSLKVGAQKIAVLMPRSDSLSPAERYVSNLRNDGQRSTRARLSQVAALFDHTYESFPWTELTPDHVLAVRAVLLGLKRAPQTINMTLSALRGVARTARQRGQISAETCAAICEVKSAEGSSLPAGRALAIEEIARLLGACAADRTAAGRRDLVLICLLYHQGLRRAEAAGLDLKDYDAERHELRVCGKGHREEIVFVEKREVRRALRAWLRDRGAAPGALLCSLSRGGHLRLKGKPWRIMALTGDAIYKILRRRAEEAGIRACSPHDLRRSHITHLLEADVDALTVQRLARHRNFKTTGRYDRRRETAGRRALNLLFWPKIQIPKRRKLRPHHRRRRGGRRPTTFTAREQAKLLRGAGQSTATTKDEEQIE